MALNRGVERAQTGITMNRVFLAMACVMVFIMALSMWKDTHREWRGYQERFAVLEKKLLMAQRAELERKIDHPDYVADYKSEQNRYLNAKSAFDTASSKLDDTEAKLEELTLRPGAGGAEEGTQVDPTRHPAAATSGVPSKDELAQLDKEFQNSGGPGRTSAGSGGTKSKGAAPKQTGSVPPAKAGGASKAELDALEKEFQDKDSQASKPGQSKGAASNPSSQLKGGPSQAELDELDKEFKDAGKQSSQGVQPNPPISAPAAQKAGQELTFEEADFEVDVQGAQARLESARRELLTAQTIHTKEMIALPKEEELRRQLADTQLEETEESLTLALADVELQNRKADVKDVAQLARWARQAATGSGAQKDEAARHIEDHVSTLRRDLRLAEGKLQRNSGFAPEIEQVYIDKLGATDRCTSCHKGVEDPLFVSQDEPFRSHPGNMLKIHPAEKFGCVSCHGGSGSALEKAEAHGAFVGKGVPLLARERVQSSCGKCHGESTQVTGESTYLAGAALFRSSGCLGCHKVKSIPTPDKEGPGLDRISEKVDPLWLVAWLKDPRSHSLEARMPSFGLKEDQAREIATYLMTQNGAPPQLPAPSPVLEDAGSVGKHLVQTLGCLGCHSIRGEGAFVAPELTNLRAKVRPAWLYSWIQNPKNYLPNSRMPDFGLTREQSVQIGNYLLSVGTPKPATRIQPLDVANADVARTGAKLIAERGCAGCHDIKGFDTMAAPELTTIGDKTLDLLEFGNAKIKHAPYDWLVAKVQDPKSFDSDKFTSRMPSFGLDERSARSIAVYLSSLTAQTLPPEYTVGLQVQDTPLIAGKRLFSDHMCSACHRIADQGGKVGPELTREGEKVQPEWLFRFLEHPERLRWWQKARMPDYHLSQAEATTLTEFLMALSNQPAPYDYTAQEKRIYPLADAGAKYFIELKCESCHPFSGKQSVPGGDIKKLGPDLAMAERRLKGDWTFRYLRDPQAFTPGTQMPTFKKSDRVYHSLVDFLMKSRSP